MSVRKTLAKVNNLTKRNVCNDEEKEKPTTNRSINERIRSNQTFFASSQGEFQRQKELTLYGSTDSTCVNRPPVVNFSKDTPPFPPSNTSPYWNITTSLGTQVEKDTKTLSVLLKPYSTLKQWESFQDNSYILITSINDPSNFEISQVGTFTVNENLNTVSLNLVGGLSQNFDEASSVKVYPYVNIAPVPSLYIPFAYFVNGNVSIETSKLDENDCVITVKIPEDFVNCYENKKSSDNGTYPGLNTKWKTAYVHPVLLKCHNFKPKKMLVVSGGGAGGTMISRNSYDPNNISGIWEGDMHAAGGGGAGSLAKIDNVNASGDYITSPFTLNDFVFCCIGKGAYASKSAIPIFYNTYDDRNAFNSSEYNPKNSGGNKGEYNYYTSPCGGPSGIVIKENLTDSMTKATQWWFYGGGSGGGQMSTIPSNLSADKGGAGQDGGSGGGGSIDTGSSTAGPGGSVDIPFIADTFTDGTGKYPKGLDYFTILANEGGNTVVEYSDAQKFGGVSSSMTDADAYYTGGGGGGGGASSKGGNVKDINEGGTGGSGYLLPENNITYAEGGGGGHGWLYNEYNKIPPKASQNTGSGGHGGSSALIPDESPNRVIEFAVNDFWGYSSGPYTPLTTQSETNTKLEYCIGANGANGTIVFVAKKTDVLILDNSTDDSMIKQLPTYGLENYYHYKVPTAGISYEGQSYND
jgi:hypothetical protein